MLDDLAEGRLDQSETTKQVICGTCDGFCPVSAKVKDGRVVKVTTAQ